MNPLPAADPMRAVVYRRVSSAGQGEGNGYGLESQAADCRRFAEANGLEVVADISEDARSTVEIDQRTGGGQALAEMLRLGAGVLLIARRDRLARDPYVAGHAKRLVAAGRGRILFADGNNGEDDSALLLSDFQDVIAAHERRAIVARLRDGREAKRRVEGAGAYVGGRPAFGYRSDGGTLVVDEAAAAVVRDAFARARRGQSIRQIADALNAEEAGGRRWHPTAVRRLLTHEPYKLQHPGRIVDPKVWNAAQTALAARRKRR